MDLLSCFNFNLHNTRSPTHRSNHTLDLIITRLDEKFVSDLSIHDPVISDHFTVHCNLNIQRLPNPKTTVAYRTDFAQ